MTQPVTATGFAYQQVNFGMADSTGGSGAGGPATRYPFIVSVTAQPGGYAQFGVQVDHWWIPVIPGTVIPSGSHLNLGTLNYSFLQPGGGTFSSMVSPASTTLLGASGPGFLEITGEIFVAGDPFHIDVISVPLREPSTGVLLAVGLVALGVGPRRGLRRARD